MRQFDVVTNPNPTSRATHPFLLVLQSDALNHVATCVVAPLVPPRRIQFFEKLLPEVTVNGQSYVIAIPDLGAVPRKVLKSPIANLENDRERIVAALDMVFLGI